MTEREFAATDESLEAVTAFVEEELDKADCPIKYAMLISVAIEEIFVNIAHYAYEGKQGDMTLGISNDGGVVTFVFTDSGVPFDPLAREDPDITLSAEDRKIGGLGIYMVKQTMDDVSYRYEDGKNILTLVKDISR